jgi:Flp pilus assembly protein TadD
MPDKPSPLLQSIQNRLAKRGPDALELSPGGEVRRWARGEATLQEIKGYTPEELHHMAQHGYTLYLNGKFKDAQIVFEGLTAIDPRSEYYYRALGVVYHRRGDAERAIRQFGHAIKVAPRSPAAFVNRAEVHISRRDYDRAVEDLDAAIASGAPSGDAHVRKARALRTLILSPRRRR